MRGGQATAKEEQLQGRVSVWRFRWNRRQDEVRDGLELQALVW